MKIKIYSMLALAFALLSAQALPATADPASSDEAEVRGVVQGVFEHLKAGEYDALYDLLPSASRGRITRERFTSGLQRTRDMYELERLEIGAVRLSGDLAVVDTVMYGRIRRPIESEGKIVSQQYMIREDGKWRVATGERSTVQKLLAANPRFAQKFPVRQPRIYLKRDGRWIDVSTLKAPRPANQ
jgi:hypothetical protein